MKILRGFPMLLSAVIGALIVVLCYYFQSLSILIGILLIIIFFLFIILKFPKQIIFSVLCVFLICCSILLKLNDISFLSSFDKTTVSGEFCVVENLNKSDFGYYYTTLKVRSSKLLNKDVKISANFYDEGCKQLKLGDIIKGEISVSSLGKSSNKLYEYSQNTFLKGTVKEYTLTENSETLYSSIGIIQNYIKDFFFDNLDDAEAATLCTLTYGDRSYMTDFFYGCVKSSGVSHIMVVSGMHLAIIMNFITALIEKLFFNSKIKALIIFIVVFFICAVCGFSPSIIRAGTTYVFVGISYLLKRDNTPSNTLGTAITIILMLSPMIIFNIGFQLSAVSTYGVLVVSPKLSKVFKSSFKISLKPVTYLIDCISITISAMIMTLPITIYAFEYISIVGILTNLLISYAATIAIILAICALCLNLLVPFFAKAVLLVCGIVTNYINSVIIVLGVMPFATVYVPQNVFLLAILIIIGLLILLISCNYRLKMLKLNKMIMKISMESRGEIKWE